MSDESRPPDSYAEESLEIEEEELPRRAASARFVVESDVGSDAALRDAMDPANQSLAEALRLSFRVLQTVILVLIVLFLASGFHTVEEGQSGVLTVWGKISSSGGEQALSPGAKFTPYPYPAAEFVVFDIENRSVDLSRDFSPDLRGRTKQQVLESISVGTALTPGRDGSVITGDGDLAHAEISAKYIIDQPVQFVEVVNDSEPARNSERLVRLALQRATVHVAASLALHEFIDVNNFEDTRQRIQASAQDVLDRLGSGIRLSQVNIVGAYPPLAIEKAMDDLQAARVDAARQVESARQNADETLNRVAGGAYPQLIAMISQYEDALDKSVESDSDKMLATINAQLEDPSTVGEASAIIQQARTYQSQVETTMGNEHRRFQSLVERYRKNPELVVRTLWLETFREVIDRNDTEIFYVPDSLQSLRLALAGSSAIRQIRRDADLKRREQRSNMSDFSDASSRIPTATDSRSRQLTEDPNNPGRLRPTGSRP